MSSGALLLKQLQSRIGKTDSRRAAAVERRAAVEPSAASVRPLHTAAVLVAAPRPTIHVVVCSGVDCAGLSGGAALLEIEELCAEAALLSGTELSGTQLKVCAGNCSLQCANAPVVNVQPPGGGPVAHHSRVDSPARCAAVVAHALGGVAVSAAASGRLIAARRWEAMRQVARSRRAGRRVAGSAEARQLASALQAEASAARGNAGLVARAERRAARLLKVVG